MNKAPNRKPAKSVIEQEANKIPNEIHHFSDSYKEKNNSIKAKRTHTKRRAIVLAILVLLLALLVACMRPIRDMFIQVFHEFTGYTYQVPVSEPGTVIEVNYVPDGYTLQSQTETPYMTHVIYVNAQGKSFNVVFNSDSTAQKDIDNENFTQEEIVEINGSNCYLFESINSDDCIAVLQTEQGLLEIMGSLDRETLLHVVREIKIK